jgi:hypothetical protein
VAVRMLDCVLDCQCVAVRVLDCVPAAVVHCMRGSARAIDVLRARSNACHWQCASATRLRARLRAC